VARAEATIDGNTVVVSSKQVPIPLGFSMRTARA
jgi:hypothetical protein